MHRTIEQTIGILCLSESPESLLMWAHYADSHRGYVIEFVESSSFFDRRVTREDELRRLRKVTYSAERPSLTLAEIEGFTPFLTKGQEWEYEAEWRIVTLLANATQTLGTGVEAIHLFEFPGDAIASVTFGSRMSEEKKSEVRNILADFPDYRHVRCLQANLPLTHIASDE